MKELIYGFMGGLAFMCVAIIICLFCHNHNYIICPIHIANIEAAHDSIPIEEVNAKLGLINKLKDQGVLLTPQEYTNNVINYYNTIITFLVSLLAIFSLVTFFHLKFITVDEVKKQVKELLRKSPDIQKIIIENTKGKIDEILYDTTERVNSIENDLKDIKGASKLDELEDDSEAKNEDDLKLKVQK